MLVESSTIRSLINRLIGLASGSRDTLPNEHFLRLLTGFDTPMSLDYCPIHPSIICDQKPSTDRNELRSSVKIWAPAGLPYDLRPLAVIVVDADGLTWT